MYVADSGFTKKREQHRDGRAGYVRAASLAI
jgi:hypothetical protein